MTSLSARAPGRVELLGNHTDYNEGVVLSAAISRYVTVHGHAVAGTDITLRSASEDQPVTVSLPELVPLRGPAAWANYPLGVVKCFQQEGLHVGGFTMSVSSDLPVGAGLSSSAALEVATACLLLKMFPADLEPMRLAKLCRKAENYFVGVQSGLLDQVSSIFGRRGQAIYLDCRAETVENMPLPAATSLLVFDCGVAHRLAGGEYNERRQQCFAAAQALGVPALRDVSGAQLAAARARLDPLLYRRAAHIVGEDERVLAGLDFLRQGDGAAFGELMYASHESSRVNFENSTPELDLLVELARGIPGVLGSRLTGGGFGGATISLLQAAAAENVASRLAADYLARTGTPGHAYLCESADGAA